MFEIIRRSKLRMVCADETIMKVGEIGLEMYFIIEGQVDIYSAAHVYLVTLSVGKPIGEMALLSETPTVRNSYVIARTDVALAILSLEDFRFVCGAYPEFNT